MKTIPSQASLPSVCITLYAYGDIKAECLDRWLDVIAFLASSGRRAKLDTIREDALICRSRSRSLAKFLESKCDVWVQVDHDITFSTDDLFELADLAHARNAPICVPYSKRALPPVPALRHLPDQPIPPAGTDVVIPIVAFATGFLAIPRNVLTSSIPTLLDISCPHPYRIYMCEDVLVPEFPSLFQPFPLETDKKCEYLSEDYAASIRLQVCGFPPFAWCKPQLGHVSNFAFKLPLDKPSINTP